MKTSALLIAQLTAFALIVMLSMGNANGMGTRGNADYLQQEKSESGHPGNERPGTRNGQEISSKTSGRQNENPAAHPEKKPRLKYREEPECPC